MQKEKENRIVDAVLEEVCLHRNTIIEYMMDTNFEGMDEEEIVYKIIDHFSRR